MLLHAAARMLSLFRSCPETREFTGVFTIKELFSVEIIWSESKSAVRFKRKYVQMDEVIVFAAIFIQSSFYKVP